MAEDRTSEQVAADDALRQAIVNCARAYYGSENGLITDYIVVLAGRDFAERDVSTVASLLSDPPPPLHAQLGLLEYAMTTIRHEVVIDDGEED